MNMQTHNHSGPTRGARRVAVLCASLASLLFFSGTAAADQGHNQLQSITAQKLGGDRVQIALQMSGDAPQPLAFTVSQPARISLDLTDTRLSLKERKTDVQAGVVNSVIAAPGDGRARVVINLTTLVPYTTRVQGNTVYVIIGSNPNDTGVTDASVTGFGPQTTGTAATAPAAAPAAAAPAPAPAPAVAAAPTPSAPAKTYAPASVPAPAPATQATLGGNQIAAVDFRREQDGSGEVTVTLPNPSIVGNVHESGGAIAVDFAGAKLPAELVRRMDVTDFATPVQYIDADNTPTGVRLTIHSTGKFEKLAYQSDNAFTVQFKPFSPEAVANQAPGTKQYSGVKITLNFQSIDVRAALQTLADASGKNIVVSDSVNGNITLRLDNVPWDQALDIILRTKGLATREFGNVMMVGTAQEISTQETAEAAAQQSMQSAAPIESAFIQVNYAKASDIATLIKSGGGGADATGMLSKRGSVNVDTRTNTLLVQDTADNIQTIRETVRRLDVAVKQVLIESRIVVANNDFTRDLGVQLGVNGNKLTSGGLMTVAGDATGVNGDQNTFINGQNAANTAANSCTTPPCVIPLATFGIAGLPDQLSVNVPVAGPTGSIAFGVLRNNFLLNLELAALQSEGKGEVVSSPHVLTADQKQAHIEQGVQIPYQQSSSSGATTTSFKNAVLSLDVTPQITPDDRVIMDLEVHNDTVGQNVPSATGGNVPTIDTRDVRTQVLVSNGDTVVLGGIYETTQSTAISKVPLLGDLPLLGWLFRNTQTINNRDELLIFVTPKIVDQNAAAVIGE